MNKLRLSIVFLGMIVSTSVMAQMNSDDPVYNNYQGQISKDQPVKTATAMGSLKTLVTSYTVCENNAVTLTNGSLQCTGYFWSSDSAGTNVLAVDSDFTSGALSNDTAFFITEYAVVGSGNAAMPAHGSTFTGNVRGYWFQAPVDMTITAFYVPTQASTGLSNVACMRFNSGPPPLWSGTTNDFTLLGLWQNEAADTIGACIDVTAGDYIGILGNRNDQNSYASAPNTTVIDGNTVTITRMGMQYPLSSTAPQDIFQESGGSISRVEFFYSTAVDSMSSTTTQIDVTVTPGDFVASTADICQGDSLLLHGNYQSISGIYNDTLTNINGCDSILSVDLTVHPVANTSQTIDICQGDSILVHGTYADTAGIYVDSTSSVLGCDSVSSVEIIVNALPATPTIGSFAQDSICMQGGLIAIPAGSPSGGYYTGTGVTGSDFDPMTAGAGMHTIGYVMVDSNSCESAPATTTITVLDCASIGENTLQGVKVFPNPTTDNLFIELPGDLSGEMMVNIFDASGKRIMTWQNVNEMITFDMSVLSNGLYVVHVQSGDKEARFKVTKR